MKPLVIYHDKCTDGFGAAFAAWLKFGDDAEYLPLSYGAIKTVAEMNSAMARVGIPDPDNQVEMYILDFSLPRDVMEWLFSRMQRVVWLDHHKSAFEMWCGKYSTGMRWHELQGRNDQVTILLDDNKSGAMLAWEFFQSFDAPALIKHIDDRDRWKFKLDGSRELHAALGSHQPWSFDQWNNILDLTDSVAIEQMIDEGHAILRAQDQNVGRMVNQARNCRIEITLDRNEPDVNFATDGDGYKRWYDGLAVNACLHQSELGHELANSSATYGLVWYLSESGKVNCSLRSNGDYDVSEIAKMFGGGGHKNAAGFETDIRTLLGWIS